MAERRTTRLDQPREHSRRLEMPTWLTNETFGVVSEKFARFMGTAQFLIGMTIFVTLWLVWNTWGPKDLQFDPRDLNYTLLTLILSLQASYAAPLILLAQNRQADRDRVALEQDRSRDERNLADTEFLTREVAALRLALRDMSTRDFVRSELRDLLDELEERDTRAAKESKAKAAQKKAKKAKAAKSARAGAAATAAPAGAGAGAAAAVPAGAPAPSEPAATPEGAPADET